MKYYLLLAILFYSSSCLLGAGDRSRLTPSLGFNVGLTYPGGYEDGMIYGIRLNFVKSGFGLGINHTIAPKSQSHKYNDVSITRSAITATWEAFNQDDVKVAIGIGPDISRFELKDPVRSWDDSKTTNDYGWILFFESDKKVSEYFAVMFMYNYNLIPGDKNCSGYNLLLGIKIYP